MTDQTNGPFYLVEIQDGAEKQRVLVTLDIDGFEAKVRVPGGGVKVTPGTFDVLEIALVSEDGVRLMTWPVEIPVTEGDTIHLPSIAAT